MAKQIAQLRFPEMELTFSNRWSTNLLDKYPGVTSLGIYALPGTKFTLNNTTDPTLIINSSGLFSMTDLDPTLNNLYLHDSSYTMAQENNHFIIIDIVYEGGSIL